MKADHTIYLPDDDELNDYIRGLLGEGCEVTGETYLIKPVLYHNGILYEYSFSNAVYYAVREYLSKGET